MTERLKLRLFQAEDAEEVSRLCNNYNVYKSTRSLPYPYPAEAASAWIATHEQNLDSDKRYEFAVTDKDSGQLYGSICLSNNFDDQNGELGYWIGEPYWGKGFGTEASKAMIEFAFVEKGFHRVYARYFKSNPASGKIMEKCGMTYEGTLPDHVLKEGTFEDLVHYGMINPESKEASDANKIEAV